MRYRQLPATELELSVVGFGTGDNAGLMVAGDERAQRAAVERALELGINYFDTAPDYGRGRAEENLGRALRGAVAPAIVCTKVEVTEADLDDVAAAVVRSVDGSLARLGLEQIDIVQIHNAPVRTRSSDVGRWGPITVDDFLGSTGAVAGFERLREQGKVRMFGFTCAHADAESVRELLDSGAFSIINVWYNALNPSAGHDVPSQLAVEHDYNRIIDDAGDRNVGVAVFRPLAGGALTGQATAGHGRHPLAGGQLTRQPELLRADLARAMELANALDIDGRGLIGLAYRFALDHRAVTTVLGGFSDLQQLEDMVDIANGPALSATERDALERAWRGELAVDQEVR